MGSQWSCLRIGMVWSVFLHFVALLAAAFCAAWRCLFCVWGEPARRLLQMLKQFQCWSDQQVSNVVFEKVPVLVWLISFPSVVFETVPMLVLSTSFPNVAFETVAVLDCVTSFPDVNFETVPVLVLLTSFSRVVFERILVLVWLTTVLFHPFKGDCQPLPFS